MSSSSYCSVAEIPRRYTLQQPIYTTHHLDLCCIHLVGSFKTPGAAQDCPGAKHIWAITQSPTKTNMYGSTQWLIWPTLLFDVILEDIGASQRQKMSINILRCVKQVMFLIFLVIPTFDNLLRRRFPIAMPRLLSRPALDLVSQLRYED